MKFKFTIALRLSIGFGMLMFAIAYSAYFSNNKLNTYLRANSIVTETYIPSAALLQKFKSIVSESKLLIVNWVYIDKKTDSDDKKRLSQLHNNDFPELINSFSLVTNYWGESDKAIFKTLKDTTLALFEMQNRIMTQLNSEESYYDPMFFVLSSQLEKGGEVYELSNDIERRLMDLIQSHEERIRLSNKNIQTSFNQFKKNLFTINSILSLTLILIAALTTASLVKPIRSLQKVILKMSEGIFPNKDLKIRSDEIGQITDALNQLVSGLRRVSGFANNIGEGKLNADFVPLSKEDELGKSLLKMRDNLKTAEEERINRQEENKIRNWTSEGLAKFSEFMRDKNEDINDFSFNIIKNLVYYIDVIQGAVFLINDSDPNDVFIEMKCGFAYQRRKNIDKRIELTEGLVGRCMVENEIIYLTDVPQDYTNIKSGLGDATPTHLLLVPIKTNEETLGVIELASFKDITHYQKDFVLQIAEMIAITFHSVRSNIQTRKLLKESQKKSEMLSAQEKVVIETMNKVQKKQQQLEYELKEKEISHKKIVADYIDRIRQLNELNSNNIEELERFKKTRNT